MTIEVKTKTTKIPDQQSTTSPVKEETSVHKNKRTGKTLSVTTQSPGVSMFHEASQTESPSLSSYSAMRPEEIPIRVEVLKTEVSRIKDDMAVSRSFKKKDLEDLQQQVSALNDMIKNLESRLQQEALKDTQQQKENPDLKAQLEKKNDNLKTIFQAKGFVQIIFDLIDYLKVRFFSQKPAKKDHEILSFDQLSAKFNQLRKERSSKETGSSSMSLEDDLNQMNKDLESIGETLIRRIDDLVIDKFNKDKEESKEELMMLKVNIRQQLSLFKREIKEIDESKASTKDDLDKIDQLLGNIERLERDISELKAKETLHQKEYEEIKTLSDAFSEALQEQKDKLELDRIAVETKLEIARMDAHQEEMRKSLETAGNTMKHVLNFKKILTNLVAKGMQEAGSDRKKLHELRTRVKKNTADNFKAIREDMNKFAQVNNVQNKVDEIITEAKIKIAEQTAALDHVVKLKSGDKTLSTDEMNLFSAKLGEYQENVTNIMEQLLVDFADLTSEYSTS